MSHWAQGWAQRQRLNDPIAKAVLQTMCYVMRDDCLLVYVSIETLEEFTEFEERTVRKALQRLADMGVLEDTGQRKRNVTVWRIPGYEQWLANQRTSPQDGRVHDIDGRALAQVAELSKEKAVGRVSANKPSQKREGSIQQPLPSSQTTPPVDVPRPLPSTGANLNPDLNRSSEGEGRRASPSGPSPSPEMEARLSHWRALGAAHVIGEWNALRPRQRVARFKDLPYDCGPVMLDKLQKLAEWAVEQEREPRLKTPRAIQDHVESELSLEMRVFKLATPAEQQAAAASN
jgi:hypothetical protein